MKDTGNNKPHSNAAGRQSRRFKKAAALLIALLLMLLPCMAGAAVNISFPIARGDTGAAVVILQQRLYELGYVNFGATGKYGDMTYYGVNLFQQQNAMQNDGIVGEKTFELLMSPDAKRAPANSSIKRIVGAGLMATPQKYGALGDYRVITEAFPVGSTITVTDFNTLKSFRVRRTGGKAHTDVQPEDAAAHATFKECFGGGYSWEKRPMMAEVNGITYAASMFGMPNNDGDKTGAGMNGSVCLYFYGCTSDIGRTPDAEHDKNIDTAAGE